jgi:hypothetical protein
MTNRRCRARCANRKVDAVTESIADGLSAFGLVVGFPLLLLGLMVSLEKLETWGLHDNDPADELEPDTVEAAVHEVEQLTAAATEREHPTGVASRSSP